MPTLQLINPLDDSDWDTRLSRHPESNFFQGSPWARVLIESYGYKPVYFTSFTQEGDLDGLIAFMEIRSRFTGTRGVSLPFSDFCPPILPRGTSFTDLSGTIGEHAIESGWEHYEIRGRSHDMSDLPSSAEYFTHSLDLTGGEETQLSRLSQSSRRNLRKAVQSGVTVERDNSPEAIAEFYRLNCLTRKEHGLPPQPRYFFRNLQKLLLAQGHGDLFLAKSGGKAIAGALFLHIGKKVCYKYGASDRTFQESRGNHLVMWEAIRHFGGHGFRSLSFGRTDLHHDGLRQYKLSWGAVEESLRHVDFNLGTGSFEQGTGITHDRSSLFFSHLPMPVLRIIGNLAYPHIG